jgi:hypothetical protein
MHRGAVESGRVQRVILGEDGSPDKAARLADVEFRREIFGGDELILRQAPGTGLFAQVGGHFGIVLQEPHQAECVVEVLAGDDAALSFIGGWILLPTAGEVGAR